MNSDFDDGQRNSIIFLWIVDVNKQGQLLKAVVSAVLFMG